MKRKILCFVLVFVSILSFTSIAYAAPPQKSLTDLQTVDPATLTAQEIAEYKNLLNYEAGEIYIDIDFSRGSQSYHGLDSNGQPYTMTIEETPVTLSRVTRAAADVRQFKVSFEGVVLACSFWGQVSSNKISNAWDWYIRVFAGSYQNVSFLRENSDTTQTLYFDQVTPVGMTRCWLRARATGSNNGCNQSFRACETFSVKRLSMTRF